MNDIPLLARRSFRIGRPVEVVFGQVLGISQDLVEGAATGAIRTGDNALRRQGLLPRRGPAVNASVSVQLSDPHIARGCLLVPTRWRIARHPFLDDVHAALEARPVSHDDVEVEARLLHHPLRCLPANFSQARSQAFLDVVTESFSRRLFWALEARHRQATGRQELPDRQAASSVQESA